MSVASCVRTVKEEPCMDCGKVTNAYDALMGRLCPQCIARRGTSFGKALAYWAHPTFPIPLDFSATEEEVKNDPTNAYLNNAPLIDHSNDIDAHLMVMRR